MNIKQNTHILFALVITGMLSSFSISPKKTEIDIEKLNGKWELPCHENFVTPGELECVSYIGYTMIKVNTETGEGVESHIGRYGGGTKFKVFKAGDKTRIDYFLPPDGEKVSGEIVTLDDKELKVKFEKKGFYTIQQRAKE